MLSLKQCKKIDPALKDLSDEELQKILAALYELGSITFDIWARRRGSKNPEKIVPKTDKPATLDPCP